MIKLLEVFKKSKWGATELSFWALYKQRIGPQGRMPSCPHGTRSNGKICEGHDCEFREEEIQIFQTNMKS